jgi:fatty-acyl-CoA synthase
MEIRHQLRACCGNGLRGDIWDEFKRRFAVPRIVEFYASTEGSFSLFNLEGKPGAIGRIPPFMAHRSPVEIIRLDRDTEQPVRDEFGFCVRCDRDEPGEAIGKVSENAANLGARFEGYSSAVETDKKILRDVFKAGDLWFRTGDLMRQDRKGFFYFVDRLGDTFRWKGENISTMEVAEAILAGPGVLDATVFGVTIPGTDGRAGMAAMVVGSDFEPTALHAHVQARLPRYARPLFLRVHEQMSLTGTFKVIKADYVRDGFDPVKVVGGLWFDDVERGAYRPLDSSLHAEIVSGARQL